MRRALPWLIGLAAFAVGTALLTVVELLGHPVYKMPSGTMQPTLRTGSYVVIDRHRSVHDGDIVVFQAPGTWSGGRHISRVLGQGGERLSSSPTGVLTRNGQRVSEPYLFAEPPDGMTAFKAVTVPHGRLWVMGDHRSMAADSRYHALDGDRGTIAVESVRGVVIRHGSMAAAYGYSVGRAAVGGAALGLAGGGLTWLVLRGRRVRRG